MSATRVLLLPSRNVFTNLAAEERLLQSTNAKTLLFYINTPCVVLGRTQNAFNEADVSFAKQQQIAIVRRRSGGGTVVHDEGNLNFCWMTSRDEYSPKKAALMISEVLRNEFNVSGAHVSDRADIMIDGMKISGAAYRISGNRAYHHGTLLVKSDLEQLSRVLRSPLRGDLTASGTKSVRSKVTNVWVHQEVGMQQLVEAIAKRFAGTEHMRTLSPYEVDGFERERQEIMSHGWVYGQTPRFQYEVELDQGRRITLHAKKGSVIENVELHAGGEHESKQHGLRDALVGRAFDGGDLAQGLRASAGSIAESGAFFRGIADVLEARVPQQFWQREEDTHAGADENLIGL
ncbi:putative lipoate-protein ligase A [Gracilariopsis chorda]|uniref:Putative lipoate-protein ligase A n=1 Tax=Gracilariopsis chorda TaxID=448386 RepID=A0A2V3J3G4_9FLOR|nr:putative lipoate-protein ligase A [Gracilariopsis chorda]|eukprot:PXF47920.1 putative lipoate-protein ligase A [Gracilariopsis chorda]